MSEKLDETIKQFADDVPLNRKHIRAFLNYEGDNPIYHQKAKVAGSDLASYVKLECTKSARDGMRFAMKNVKALKG